MRSLCHREFRTTQLTNNSLVINPRVATFKDFIVARNGVISLQNLFISQSHSDLQCDYTCRYSL